MGRGTEGGGPAAGGRGCVWGGRAAVGLATAPSPPAATAEGEQGVNLMLKNLQVLVTVGQDDAAHAIAHLKDAHMVLGVATSKCVAEVEKWVKLSTPPSTAAPERKTCPVPPSGSPAPSRAPW